MSDDQTPSPSPTALVVLLAAATLTVMAGATIAPSLPGLLAHFSDDPLAPRLVPLILTVPGLAIALSAPFAGVVLDRASKRDVLIGAMLVYAAAGSSGLYLTSLEAILVGRFVLGLAVGTIMTASVALVGDLYVGEMRERVMGWQGAAMSFGGVLFVGGGGLLAALGWRVPFAVYLAPLALVPLALVAIPRRSAPSAEDDPGTILPPSSAFPWRHVGPLYLLGALSMLTFYVVPTLIAFVVEAMVEDGGAAALAGLAIGVATFCAGVVSLLYQRLHARLSFEAIAALGFGGIAAGFALVFAAQGLGVLLLGLAVAGAGSGTILPNNNAWLLSRIPAAMRGRASGGMTASIFLGQFSCGLVGPLLVAAGGLSFAYLAMGLLAATLAAMLTATAIRRPQRAVTPTSR